MNHAIGLTAAVSARSSRAAALSLALMLLIIGFAFQGTRALWEPDEGRYTAVALEMLDSGDYLMPRLNDYQPHLTKPPLTYWALAASMAVFGRSTWAVRLPHAMAFVATGLLVFGLARRYVPERPWLPAFVWGTSLLPVLAANVVNTDALLALFETLAVYAWVRASASASAMTSARGPWLMWCAFGLAFLTKGPPALLPLAPIVVWTAVVRGRSAVASIFAWRGLGLFALIGGGWFVWLFAHRPELMGHFFGYELYDRIFTGVHRRNPEWYGALKIYLPVLILAALPWLLLARRWPRALATSFSRAVWRQRFRADPDGAFLQLWILLPLAVFFLARSRLFLYVLPLAVPISLLIGRDLSRRFGAVVPEGWRAALAAWLLVAMTVKGGLMYLPSRKDAAVAAQALAPHLIGADRIVYIGERARYGLRFYTGLPVEQYDEIPDGRAANGAAVCAALARAPHALVVGGGDQGAGPAAMACAEQAVAHVGRNLWRAVPAVTAALDRKETSTWTEAVP